MKTYLINKRNPFLIKYPYYKYIPITIILRIDPAEEFNELYQD